MTDFKNAPLGIGTFPSVEHAKRVLRAVELLMLVDQSSMRTVSVEMGFENQDKVSELNSLGIELMQEYEDIWYLRQNLIAVIKEMEELDAIS